MDGWPVPNHYHRLDMQRMNGMLSGTAIAKLHDECVRAWHNNAEADSPVDTDFSALVRRQHRANFELWHIEDEARRPNATDADLASVKRRIDATNQRRNDLAEQIDEMLLNELIPQALPRPDAPLHSESPGLMIDRLSILSLKIYHTREEAGRSAAPAGHAERNRARLELLVEQRSDLAACLHALWHETLEGRRRFKVYRQLKMYNDPELNPAVYGARFR